MADGRHARGPRWIERRRSPRYDIWVSNTQAASPWACHPVCMALRDGALGQPMTRLHGHAAGNVVEDIARAAGKLRGGQPVPWSGAAGTLEFMRHLCACDPGRIVRVETPAVVSYFELATGVLAGAITSDQALRAARERGGSEAGVRGMLNWAKAALENEEDRARRYGGSARTGRRRPASAGAM